MSYPTVGALFHDGLRISRAMTLKCALAGIWCGGGKGLVAENSGYVCECVYNCVRHIACLTFMYAVTFVLFRPIFSNGYGVERR